MFRNALLIVALALTGLIALWGLIDNDGLATVSQRLVRIQFTSRAWFIMLTASILLIACIVLAFTRFGRIRLGRDDDRPEFSTPSWLAMLFAAGMGVGLLYWGSAEPLSHYLLARDYLPGPQAASRALFTTNFHWGLHAWAIYASVGLVLAYFAYRRDAPLLLSTPLLLLFGATTWARPLGWLINLMAIVAIAIGLGGSIAMGVFQVESGLALILGIDQQGLALVVFAMLCAASVPPLIVELGKGMTLMSYAAMGIAGLLVVYILLAGPTSYIMSTVVEQIGVYFSDVLVQGFKTFTFFDQRVGDWFQSWTLTYMVWWLAWSPFVGVFIARISRGRTIREFVLGVVLVPSLFSLVWFGAFGAFAFSEVQSGNEALLASVETDVSSTSFQVLDRLPLSALTSLATIVAAFLFIVTSLVSAAFVLGMFSTEGDLNPSRRVRLSWGVILAALGLVMILSDSIDAVRSVIALGAIPFVFIVLLLLLCLFKGLRQERPLGRPSP